MDSKKRIIYHIPVVLIMILLLSGCNGTEELLLYSGSSSAGDISSFAADSTLYTASAFSTDKCIIPESEVGQNVDKNITASGALHVDITDGKMLYANGIYDRLEPASLTKLATAIVCLKYGNMSDTVTISHEAANLNVPGAKLCFLQEGDVINFETLLTSFLVYSGNDAGVALAEHISGSEEKFVELMNSELKKIGCADTNFVNPHGLPAENHYTTVYDIYLMLNELSKNEKFLEITSLASYTANFKDKNGREITKVYESTDKYLTGEQKLPKGVKVLAGKTGTTSAAGYCLTVLSERKTGHRYISVVMKASSSESLYSQMSKLLKIK